MHSLHRSAMVTPVGLGPVTGRWTAIVGAAVALVVLMGAAACSSPPADPAAIVPTTGIDGSPTESGGGSEDPDAALRAEVVWTAHGIPHITASNMGDLGFGQGWAAATDRGCDLAVQLQRVSGRLARWFGPGPDDTNVTSDLAYAALGLRQRATMLLPQLGAGARAMLEGYAEGFNLWQSSAADPAGEANGEASGIAGQPWCAGAPWVQPIEAADLLAHHHDLAMVATGRRYLAAMASAQPPSQGPTQGDVADPASSPGAGSPGMGSPDTGPVGVSTAPTASPLSATAWGLGRRAAGGRQSYLAVAMGGPWDGELAPWENHLTIPGELDVYGFSLVGLPGVVTGFNPDVAWAQVPSAKATHTIAALELVEGSPTTYRVDDGDVPMEPIEVVVEVQTGDGGLTPVRRTLWSTSLGPVLDLPGLGWTATRAYALGDTALVRPALVEQFVAINAAGSLAELEDALAAVAATGSTATVATAASGWVLFADGSATPAPGDTVVAPSDVDPTGALAGVVAATGAAVVDGARAGAAGLAVDGAVAPGLLQASAAPRVQVRDWVAASGVTNGLVSDSLVLESWSPLVVAPNQVLAPVERRSFLTVSELADMGESRPLVIEDVATALLDNRGLVSSVLLDEVVARCTDAEPVAIAARRRPDGGLAWPAQRVDVGEACRLLGRWSGSWTLDDQAPAVWSQFLAAFNANELRGAGALFAADANPADPIGTPGTLAPAPGQGPDPVLVALAEAAVAVQAAGFAIDDAWLSVQWTDRAGERIPMHGDTGTDGSINAMTTYAPGPVRSAATGGAAGNATGGAADGDIGLLLDPRTGLRRGGRVVNGGTSAVMVVRYAGDSVTAQALLVPGQSGDPDSPFHVDQAYRFSDRAWRPVVFDLDGIATGTERTARLTVDGRVL